MAASPLPDFRSSLSKYIPIEEHWKLLRSLKKDIPSAQIEGFEEAIIVTARQRYFREEEGIVRRDRLIDLVQEEGTFTARVKMVMYFLFLFRDPRYRDFICTEVARKNGLWDGAVFHSEIATFFPKAGGRKAFTNLRRMLIHLDLLSSEPNYAVLPFPALDTWFADAVEVAAQYVTDPVARQQLLANPQSFLVQHKIHGLLNADAKAIAEVTFNTVYEDAPDQLPIYQLGSLETALTTTALKTWDRQAPLKRKDLTSTEVWTNPALMERAHGQHFNLEQLMAAACKASDYKVKQTVHIDLLALNKDSAILFEMKSCTAPNLRSQVRRAISQVLEYMYLYRDKLPAGTMSCIVVERKPRGRDAWLIGYLESLEICLVWKKDKSDHFGCSPATKTRLLPVLSAVSDWAI